MSDEYHYTRGVGWTLKPPVERYEGEIDGKRFVIEHRKPNPGERFYYLHKMSSKWLGEDKVDFERMVDDMRVGYGTWFGPFFNTALFDGNVTERFDYTYKWSNDNYTHVTVLFE